jgi:predicted nucleic acid-binding protein
MNGKYLFDTNILIDWLDGNEAVSGVGRAASSELYLSVITRMELLSAVRNTKEREAAIYGLMSLFTIVPLNEEVEKNAIAIRRGTGLKLPDAIIAASSIVSGAILISRDLRLANIKWGNLQIQTIVQ